MELSGKVVVVTGGASGIGRATCKACSERGAHVAIWDNDLEGAKTTAAKLSGSGRAIPIEADVGDPDGVKSALDTTLTELGRLDVMVTAAAVGGYGPIPAVSDDAWKRIIDIDLNGVFWCLREAAGVMAANEGGRIVVIGSDRGLQPEPGWTPYCVAKAAVIHLARCAAAEFARDRILVNVVCPGPTDTAMLDPLRALPGLHEHISSRPLVGRLARPEEIAEAILFCAGNDFMTGAVLLVDGGAALAGTFGIQEHIDQSSPPPREQG